MCFRYYELLLHPDSPLTVGESGVDSLGLFLRRGKAASKEGDLLLPDALFGVVFEVDAEDFLREYSLRASHRSGGGGRKR